MRYLLPLFVGLATLCIGTQIHAYEAHTVHEKRDPAQSSKWVKLQAVPETYNLTVRIGLKQSNLDNAHVYMQDVLVSTCYSP